MKYRNCQVCKKDTDCDSPICKHCNKGVFVVDFGNNWEKSFGIPLLQAYTACYWVPIIPPPAHGPTQEKVCLEYKPEVFGGN